MWRRLGQLQRTGEQARAQGITLLYSRFHRDTAGRSPIWTGPERLWGCVVDQLDQTAVLLRISSPKMSMITNLFTVLNA